MPWCQRWVTRARKGATIVRCNFLSASVVTITTLLLSVTAACTAPIHAWYYASFLTVGGRVEICPGGQPGAVVLYSQWHKDLEESPPPLHDSAGHIWSNDDYIRLAFRYSEKKGQFDLQGFTYIHRYLFPEWSSFDWGHSTNLRDVLSAATGCTGVIPLPDGSRVKWIQPYEIHAKRLYVVIWEPQDGAGLHCWILSTGKNGYRVEARLPPLKGQMFQGVGVMDCLGVGRRDIALYAVGVGAHNLFPQVFLLRISEREAPPDNFFDYDYHPKDYLDRIPFSKLHVPFEGSSGDRTHRISPPVPQR